MRTASVKKNLLTAYSNSTIKKITWEVMKLSKFPSKKICQNSEETRLRIHDFAFGPTITPSLSQEPTSVPVPKPLPPRLSQLPFQFTPSFYFPQTDPPFTVTTTLAPRHSSKASSFLSSHPLPNFGIRCSEKPNKDPRKESMSLERPTS